MRFKKLILLVLCLIPLTLTAQLTDQDLLDIKDKADGKRVLWHQAFDKAVTEKNFSELPGLRADAENFIEQRLLQLRRQYASGDGRELLTTVTNYLQIQKQFVRNVMIPAESIVPEDEQAIADIHQQIENFAEKEKMFLVDIRNALRSGPPPIRVANFSDEEPEDTDEPEEEAEPEKKNRKKKTKKKKEPEGDFDRRAQMSDGDYY